MRKPKGIETKDIYANIQRTRKDSCAPSFFVYIGGLNNEEPKQIHLKNQTDIRKLSAYLAKVVKWMDGE